MKLRFRRTPFLTNVAYVLGSLCLCLIFTLYGHQEHPAISIDTTSDQDVSNPNIFRFTILHTGDLHSHFEGIGPDHHEYTAQKQGHYARLSFAIQNIRKRKEQLGEPVLVLDAGDFYSGTLFHEIAISNYTDAVPELEFLHHVQADASTIGNHEFDISTPEIALLFRKANAKGLKVPFVASNIYFKNRNDPLRSFFCDKPSVVEYESQRHDSSPSIYCQQGQQRTNVQPYLIKELKHGRTNQTARVAIIGLFSPDSAYLSVKTESRRNAIGVIGFDDEHGSQLFDDYVKHTQRIVDHVTKVEKAQIVILLAHSGYPEDYKLVQAIRGAHIHISSHTHAQYVMMVPPLQPRPHAFASPAQRQHHQVASQAPQPTLITQVNPYGVTLGKLELGFNLQSSSTPNPAMDSQLLSYPSNSGNPLQIRNRDVHVSIDSNVPMDKAYAARIQVYKKLINDHILYHRGLHFEYDTIVAHVHQQIPYDHQMGSFVVNGIYKELQRLNQSQIDVYYSGLLLIRGGFDHIPHNATSAMPHHTPSATHDTDTSTMAPNQPTKYQFSDIYRLLGITTNSDIVCFYLTKQEVLVLIDIQDLYNRFVDSEFVPLYSESLKHSTRWYGIPFVNRIHEPTLHGKPFDQWPELVHLCTVDKLVRYFFLPSIVQWLPKSLHLKPRNERGEQISSEEDLVMRALFKQSNTSGSSSSASSGSGSVKHSEYELFSTYLHRIEHVKL